MSSDSIGLNLKNSERYLKSLSNPETSASRLKVRDLQAELQRRDIELQLTQEELKKSAETMKQYQNKVAELSSKLISRDDDFYALSEKIEKLREQHNDNLQNIKDQLTNYNIDISLIKGVNSNESEYSPQNANLRLTSGSLLVSPIIQSPAEFADWKSQEFQKEVDVLKEKLVIVTRERDNYRAWKENHIKETQELENYVLGLKSKLRRVGRALKSFTAKGTQLQALLNTSDPAVKKSINAFYEEKLELESAISEIAGQSERSNRRRSPEKLMHKLSKKKQEVEQLSHYYTETVESLTIKIETLEDMVRNLNQEKEALAAENKDCRNIFTIQQRQLDEVKKEHITALENMMNEYKLILDTNRSLSEENDNLIVQRDQINEKYQKEAKFSKRLSNEIEELQSKIIAINGANNVLQSQIEMYRKSLEESLEKGGNNVTRQFEIKDNDISSQLKDFEIKELQRTIEELKSQKPKDPVLSLIQVESVFIEQSDISQEIIKELNRQLTEKERILNDYILEIKLAENKIQDLEKLLLEKDQTISFSNETIIKLKQDQITNMQNQVEEKLYRIGGLQRKKTPVTNEFDEENLGLTQKINCLDQERRDMEKEKNAVEKDRIKAVEETEIWKGKAISLETENKDLKRQIVELMRGIQQYEIIIQNLENEKKSVNLQPKSKIEKIQAAEKEAGIPYKIEEFNDLNIQIEKLKIELNHKNDQLVKEQNNKNKAIQVLKERYEQIINDLNKELDEKADACEKLQEEKLKLEKVLKEKETLKAQNEKKIKSLENELEEKQSLFSFAEKEIENLKKEKDYIAKELQEEKQENKRLEDRMAVIESIGKEKEIFEDKSTEISIVKREKELLSRKLQQSEEKIKKMADEILGYEDLSKVLAEKVEKLEDDKEDATKLTSKLKKEISDSKEGVKKIFKEKKELENVFEEYSERVKGLGQSNEEAQKRIKDLENKSKKSEKEKSDLAKQNQELETRIQNYEKLIKQFDDFQKQNQEQAARLQNYEKRSKQLDDLQRQNQELEAKLQSAERLNKQTGDIQRQNQDLEAKLKIFERIKKQLEDTQKQNQDLEARLKNSERNGKIQDELLNQIQQLSIELQNSERRNKQQEELLKPSQELEIQLQNYENQNKHLSDEVFELKERLGILEFEKNELMIENDVESENPAPLQEDSSKVLSIKVAKQKEKIKNLKVLAVGEYTVTQIQNQILSVQSHFENQLKLILLKSEKLLSAPNKLLAKFLKFQTAWSIRNSNVSSFLQLKEKSIGLESENNSLKLQINALKDQIESIKSQLENCRKTEAPSQELLQKLMKFEKEKSDLNLVINNFSAEEYPQKIARLEKENSDLKSVIKNLSSEDFPQRIAKLEKEKSELGSIVNKFSNEEYPQRISKLEKEKSELASTLNKISAEEYPQKIAKLEKEKSDLNLMLSKVEELPQKISKLEKEKADLGFIIAKISADHEKLLSEKDDLNKVKSSLETEKAKLLETRDKLIMQCNKHQDEIDDLKSQIASVASLQKKCEELMIENIRLTDEAHKSNQRHEEEAEKLKLQFDEISTKYESRERLMKSSMDNKMNQVSSLIEENAKLKNKINNLTSENQEASLKEELEKIKALNAELYNKIQEEEEKNNEKIIKIEQEYTESIKQMFEDIKKFKKEINRLEFEKSQLETIVDSITKELEISSLELQKLREEHTEYKEKAELEIAALKESRSEDNLEIQKQDEFLHEELTANIDNLTKENGIIRRENKRLKSLVDKIEPQIAESDPSKLADSIKQVFSEFKSRMLMCSPRHSKSDILENYIGSPKIHKESIVEIPEESSSFAFGEESLFGASSFDSIIKMKTEAPLTQDYKNIIQMYEEDLLEKERIIKEQEEKIKILEKEKGKEELAVSEQ
ncbi:unnamed protein product [Blepharisma stoltei]|uniref:Uncharacterized protein n=1 Tax=Blepharisma stoltei TaxID=1481888 RepID=A0AAU9JW37_9CILI|nr:unnamed protein product [Blepharisma stoltei]